MAELYNIPIPVTVNNGGQEVVNSTYVNDNTSTTDVSFSDAVLLAASQIDTRAGTTFSKHRAFLPGLIAYGSRMFAWGE
jgi:hypothetical protein